MRPASTRVYGPDDDVISINAYRVLELKGFLIYGSDFIRKMDIFRAPPSITLMATLVGLFLILATFILYIFRRRFHLPGDDLAASFFDCLIPFIGGGNLRMVHRFERWFFGIMLVGAFFTMSIIGGDLVDNVVINLTSEISTFEELNRRSPHLDIYYDSALRFIVPDINEMLR